MARISRSKLFERLGAPLRNFRWSWGAVSKSGRKVYLAVWEDEFRRIKGKKVVRLTNYRTSADRLGYKERLRHIELILRHIELIEKGFKSYGVLCTAKDPSESPRSLKDFNREELLVGGKLIKNAGDWWLEDGGRKAIT